MQLPADLREALARTLEGVSRTALTARAKRISELYRDGGTSAVAVRDDADALAYAITRLPATYAAVRNVLRRLEERCPGFHPRSALDLGSGPGSASWAAADAWPQVDSIAQVDCNSTLLRFGKSIAQGASSQALRNAGQVAADLARDPAINLSADLVIVSYTLAELSPSDMELVLLAAWRRCTGALVIVEPGTPSGYQRILRARDLLRTREARIVAPCPHELRCPLVPPDWCHFAQRIARTRDHMILKSAELPYEDEKFSYLVFVRESFFQPSNHNRILARPEISKSAITVKLCKLDGTAQLIAIHKRDVENFRRARRKKWGDEY
jgi:ribosomal protein RSM22 (predicted rRNA methylase)